MIFVTGATGFIGQRLVERLEGEVKILSRQTHPDYETIVCDLQTEEIPDHALDGIASVFHLAGFAHDLRTETQIEHLYY